MSAVLDQIRAWLDAQHVPYRHVRHEPTYTSEQSAAARGEDVRVGGKALLVKTDDSFRLFVLSAALKLDSARVREALRVRKTRFATADELKQLTGLVPGSVPPFGPPILPFELLVDESITQNEKIAFNAGSLTDSLVLAVCDYLRVCGGRVLRFAAT